MLTETHHTNAVDGDEPLEPRQVSLADRYAKRTGWVYLSGLHALVRLPIEQARRDRADGLTTRAIISGYEGSPLAGYDLELQRRSALLDEYGIVHRPAVNEELGVNVVQGSQLAATVGTARFDGVTGYWYGKAPGLDRATDAMRHANLSGADPAGGAVAFVGDDSIAKSSSVPSSSEIAMAEIGMTVLSPSDAQEILTFGLHAVALSRFCGLWSGIKLATNIVDGAVTVNLDEALDVQPILPDRMVDGREYVHQVSADYLAPNLGILEKSALTTRPQLALRYAAANNLNRIVGDPEARFGLIAHGATYVDALEALRRLGVDPFAEGSGIRILKLGMISPLEPGIVEEFSRGLDEIVVVEEKRAFVELGVKDILFGRTGAPRVYGKRGPDDAGFLRKEADIPPEIIAAAIAPRLVCHLPGFAVPESPRRPSGRLNLALLPRLPFFCSGCPHNRSTRSPEGSLVGAGIGCHGLVMKMDDSRAGDLGLCQMGGEGATWIGLEPFVEEKHTFQNLGDGTYHHSGSLAVRAAVAAGVSITYKILFNGAVAMTGGQQAIGGMSVPELAQELLAEGVRRIVITTEEPADYRKVRLPARVEVRHRDRLLETQDELSEVEGVTVLIHDQECATELRRKRKRKKVAEPTTRIFINERVCEGCGDCGVKSNCLSVQPVDTEFGRKTRIHQTSCNKDYSCVDGDCPSFLAIEPGTTVARRSVSDLPSAALPAPAHTTHPAEFGLRMTGIGGTGVVTTSQILAIAAFMDGWYVRGLDQLGLSQKGGSVVSDLLLTRAPAPRANKIGAGSCDLYLGFDLLVAASDNNLVTTSPDRTAAVISTAEVPTGTMVSNVDVSFPAVEQTIDVIQRRVQNLSALDARELCLGLFGDDQYANVLMLGVAVQSGNLPIAAETIESAITLNGAAVERNTRAFRCGRQWVADREALIGELAEPAPERPVSEQARAAAADLPADAPEETVTLFGRRYDDLVAYQNTAYAKKYAGVVVRVAEAERAAIGRVGEVTVAVAQHLHKLMAYKDEYEVARLVLEPELRHRIAAEFGADAKWSYKLHPPFLRALGVERKISLGRWADPAFRLLRAMRHLRGTPFDVFGPAKMRRLERQLVGEYIDAMADALRALTPATHELVESLAGLPDRVRGYEDVKVRNVVRYRDEMRAITTTLGSTGSVGTGSSAVG